LPADFSPAAKSAETTSTNSERPQEDSTGGGSDGSSSTEQLLNAGNRAYDAQDWAAARLNYEAWTAAAGPRAAPSTLVPVLGKLASAIYNLKDASASSEALNRFKSMYLSHPQSMAGDYRLLYQLYQISAHS